MKRKGKRWVRCLYCKETLMAPALSKALRGVAMGRWVVCPKCSPMDRQIWRSMHAAFDALEETAK